MLRSGEFLSCANGRLLRHGPATRNDRHCLLWAQKRDFPQNMEAVLGLRAEGTGVQRKAAVLRVVMQQILAALQSCHDTGACWCSAQSLSRDYGLFVLSEARACRIVVNVIQSTQWITV